MTINPTKRIHNKIPTFIKFYTVYQYDRLKFRKLLNEWLKSQEGENRTLESLELAQKRILEHCYKKDLNGNKKRDSDSKHIFRIKALNNIYEAIALETLKGQQIIPFDGCFINLFGLSYSLNIYTEDNYTYQGKIYKGQKFSIINAELEETKEWSIYKRTKIHLNILRLIRKGKSIKQAVSITKKKYHDWWVGVNSRGNP